MLFGGYNIDQGHMNDVYIIDFHTMVFSFMLCWNSPVYWVCDALVEMLWLLCIVKCKNIFTKIC